MGTNQGTDAGVVFHSRFAARSRLRPGSLEFFHGPAFPFLAPVAQRFPNDFAGVAILTGGDLLGNECFPVLGKRDVHEGKIGFLLTMSIDSTGTASRVVPISMT